MVIITTQLLAILTIISYACSAAVTYFNTCFLIEWDLFPLTSFSVSVPVILDSTSIIFISTVLTIATSVIQFAKTYMAHDKTCDRFIILVLLFVISIMFLILFPHIIVLLMGWDGLGVTSFVLVIYYNNPKSLGAGIITALTNRVGDVMLLITIALIISQGHWLALNTWGNDITWWTPFLIITAALTKRAQIPFSSWLPAAIAAPTPVRALVHSSTLVTAGVYLLYRFYPFIEELDAFKPVLLIISSITILMASASAIAECDIKKIIALSTLRQVAIIIFTLRIGLPEIAFFHLVTHALFKALLFICAGNLIDIHHHSQDLRLIGNVSGQLPAISSAITVANIALCGAPFIAGFYSKDLIIESTSILIEENNIIIITIFIIATILTTAYSTRFSIYVLFSPSLSPSPQYTSEGKTQYIRIALLTILAIIGGALTNWLFTAPTSEPNFSSLSKALAPIMVLTGLILGTTISIINNPGHPLVLVSHCFIWFLTPISTHLAPKITMHLPLLELKETDQGWLITPSLILNQITNNSHSLISAQNNTITKHLSFIFILTMWLITI